MPDDLNTNDAPSTAKLVVARVGFLTEPADTAARCVRALAAGDDATAASEVVELREMCEERAGWSKLKR